jgi:molybdate/tungstate transport system substrate-binding protein
MNYMHRVTSLYEFGLILDNMPIHLLWNNKFLFLSAFSVVSSIFALSTLGGFVIAEAANQGQGKVFVMYAGSLLNTFEVSLGPSFQNETGYTYVGEGKGSVQISNLIVDGFRKPDIFVSVGTIPIVKLIDNKPPLANWLIKFASAEMVIAYSPNSHFYADLEKARTGIIPWYKVISENGFKFGRTDPELDPKGYNMIISANLSNIYYNDSTIKQRILGDDRNPKQVFPEETLNSILEAGQVDAIAAYKHEAISRGLSFIALPSQINLGNPDFSSFYKKASYTFSTNGKVVQGEPIYLSITIPNTNKNIDGAISFVNYLTSPNEGKLILEKQGLDYLKAPNIEGNKSKIPSSIVTMGR